MRKTKIYIYKGKILRIRHYLRLANVFFRKTSLNDLSNLN